MSDALARARIENELDRSFLVEAAAGTGKTTALVGRIVRLVATGRARITEIAAITFTERASGELVLRLREKLELARHGCADSNERLRIDEALADFEAAYVGTIHGFCAELLRARPLDAGVDPSFVLLGDDERNALLDETTDRFLEDAIRDAPEGLRRAIARPRDHEPPPPRTLFAREIRELVEHRDQDPRLRQAPFDRDGEVNALLVLARTHAGGKLASWLEGVDHLERTRPRDYDALEHQLVSLLRESWLPKKGALRAALEAFQPRADADLAFCLARDLAPAVRRYEQRKRALGVLDHLDSLLFARALLASSRTARLALRERFRFLFVDEVQDVDPIQKDVILLLVGEDPDEGDVTRVRPRPGSLYLVGDPKQAIYGFRRADLRTYLALKNALVVPGHAELLQLSTSFRPRPAIAAIVNHAFATVFDGSIVQAGHVALEAARPPATDFPSVIALPVPGARTWNGKITRKSVEAGLPDAIASFLRWLVHESGLRIEDPGTGALVSVAPRHVAVLFKTLKDNGTAQARALERHGVAHAFVAPEAFFEREGIVAASALAAAIEWPDDALSVYATLRGLLLGIPDADLLAYRSTVGPLHPLARVDAEGLGKEMRLVHGALALLGQLHHERHTRSIEATFAVFLERCESEVLLLLTERPGEIRALGQLRQIARRADARGTPFRDLARWLGERVDDPSLGGVDAVADPERTDAVSLLTVHGAKGLELPVIVLGDPCSRPQWTSGASRYVDPTRQALVRKLGHFAPIELRENLDAANAVERAEAARLLYVAATRARDVLVVPTVGALEIEDSWIAPIARALVPADPRAETTRWPTAPAFGDRSIDDAELATPGVRPGHHAAHLGGVTWWDPAHLERPLPPREARGLVHLVERVEGRSVAEAEREHEAARARAIDDAALNALDVQSARRAARTPLGAALAVSAITTLELGSVDGEGIAYARLVRDLAACEDGPELDRVASARARALGATDAERDAAVRTALRFRQHPIVHAIRSDPRSRSNVPYVLATDAGPVVWGRVPLVGPEGDGLAVLRLVVGDDPTAEAEICIAASAIARAENTKIHAYLARIR